MARLYVFAEGVTEQTYAGTVLTPHLSAIGLYVQPPVLVSHGKRKGIVHRGGVRRYAPMRNDIVRFLKQEKSADVHFTTMIDLYALCTDFPRMEEAEKLRHDPYARIEFLEEAFATDIGDARFVPYLQLHEFEALLFADPTAFGHYFDDCRSQIAALQGIVDQCKGPERIDDGEATAPSKRISGVFKDYADAKATAGPQVAEAIGLGVLRAKCPHFDAWLKRLERLGHSGADVVS